MVISNLQPSNIELVVVPEFLLVVFYLKRLLKAADLNSDRKVISLRTRKEQKQFSGYQHIV